MNDVHMLQPADALKVSCPPSETDLAARIASRICHDVASPLGAIGNGLELLQLSGLPASPELELLQDSVASANARLRYLRLAFGTAGAQSVGRAEITDLLAAVSRGTRLAFDWAVRDDVPRSEVKVAFLLLQCLESAMPLGGRIEVGRNFGTWTVSARSPRLRINEVHWASLQSAAPPPEAASLVQFALLPQALGALGRELSIALGSDQIEASF